MSLSQVFPTLLQRDKGGAWTDVSYSYCSRIGLMTSHTRRKLAANLSIAA